MFLRALSEDREEATRAVTEALGHEDASPLDQIRGHMLRMAIDFSSSDRRVSLTTRALVESTGEQDPLSTSTKAGIDALRVLHGQRTEEADERASMRD